MKVDEGKVIDFNQLKFRLISDLGGKTKNFN